MLKGLQFLDVAEIQEAETDEVNKVKKEEFSQVFKKMQTAQKPAYMPMELSLSKKVMSSIF